MEQAEATAGDVYRLLLPAFSIALDLERSWVEAAKTSRPSDWEDWADGACVEVCIQLRDELEQLASEVNPKFIWGEFMTGQVGLSHAWVEVCDDIILDPTAGQFLKDSAALRVIFPTHPFAERYHEVEIDPEWARD